MFSNDDIAEVMADEIGEVRGGQSRTLLVGEESDNVARAIYRRAQYAETKRFWPEGEAYPSFRWNTLVGPTKAARYGQAL